MQHVLVVMQHVALVMQHVAHVMQHTCTFDCRFSFSVTVVTVVVLLSTSACMDGAFSWRPHRRLLVSVVAVVVFLAASACMEDAFSLRPRRRRCVEAVVAGEADVAAVDAVAAVAPAPAPDQAGVYGRIGHRSEEPGGTVKFSIAHSELDSFVLRIISKSSLSAYVRFQAVRRNCHLHAPPWFSLMSENSDRHQHCYFDICCVFVFNDAYVSDDSPLLIMAAFGCTDRLVCRPSQHSNKF
jgi:type IV secretory pathway VirB2 component (pilin)